MMFKAKLHTKKAKKLFILIVVCVVLTVIMSAVAYATSPGVSVTITGAEEPTDRIEALELLFFVTILSILPSIIIMMTSFTRTVIVLSFVRNSIGLQQTPPNQVIIGLALFLTLFIMQPVIKEVKTVAYEPYVAGEMTQSEAVKEALKPMKTFMLENTKESDMNLFLSLADKPMAETSEQLINDTGLDVVIPAFITSELKRSFTMGFLIFIPFLIIDMVVASTLMSMGMIMLPPAMISLPFKLLLFVLVDGWGLVVKSLVISFS